MAGRRIGLPETPKSNDTGASNSRRYSIGKPREKEKIVPNYLRASTGSCHDFCKYGRNHEFEAKARPPFLRRKAKKPPDEGSLSHSLPEDDIIVLVKHKPNSNPKGESKFPDIIKGEVTQSPISLNRRTVVSTSSTATNKMSSRMLLSKSVDRQNPASTQVQAKNEAAAREVLIESSKNRVERTNSLAPNGKQTAARKLLTNSIDSGSSMTEFERRKIDALERKKASAIKLRTSLDSKTNLSQKIVKKDMPLPSGKLKASMKQVPSKVIEAPVSAKRASSSKLRLSLPDDSLSISSVRRNSDSLTGQKTTTSKIAAKGVHMSTRALLSPKSSSRCIVKGQSNPKASLSLKPTLKVQLSSRALLSPKTSSARNREGSEVQSLLSQCKFEKGNDEHQADLDQFTDELKGSNNDSAQEKTLYVIKMDTENKASESDHNENLSAELSSPPLLAAESPPLPESSMSSSHNEEDEEEFEYSVTDIEDDSVSEYDDTESFEEAHPLGVEQKRRDRKTGLQHLEDKDSQPFKLRFRQGRVIEMQPEHNTPRRLKFRKGRSIGENQNFKSDGRRSFKKRGADGNANDSNSNSEKVVLRHQDAHGKKDAQGLFNNVIEETASKLVETRKSKVKALVGAFETVISLQDGKPTANTAS